MGAGLQKLAAVANLIAYYGIGLAVGSALIFATELGLLGKVFRPILSLINKQSKKKSVLASHLKNITHQKWCVPSNPGSLVESNTPLLRSACDIA